MPDQSFLEALATKFEGLSQTAMPDPSKPALLYVSRTRFSGWARQIRDYMREQGYQVAIGGSMPKKPPTPVLPLELAFIRWSVVHRKWYELSGDMPSLEGFLAGWFCRVCEAEQPVVVARFRDSFNCGWREASEQIVILSRERVQGRK